MPSKGSIPHLSGVLAIFSALVLYTPTASADGYGLIGAGKWMYRPTCAHACRKVLANSPLLCVADHAGDHSASSHSHSSATPPECYQKDEAFLRTMALCIDEYCPRDNVPLSVIEDYWAGHLTTGTLANMERKPIASYSETLVAAHKEIANVTRAQLPLIKPKQPLNRTSLIAESTFEPFYNGYKHFEMGENQHTRNSIAVAVTPIAIPILFSLLRFVPLPGHWMSRITTFLHQPVMGTRLSTPMAGNVGLMPTRGQALFIAYFSLINLFLMVFPYHLKQPNYIAESNHAHLTQIVMDRAGALCFACFVALFLFSARNNVLLWVTNWSHSTYLLLHRWVAYNCIFQGVVHSVLCLYWYDRWADDIAEAQLPYWYWGIIATLALCLLLPFSLLPVRQRAYEFFLISHKVLTILLLVGGFLHIWYLFAWNWGYDIWVYIGGGIWFADRLIRFLRIVRNGVRTAEITVVDPKEDLMHIRVDGVFAHGHAYLYFPTLSWMFWECHPFSVMSSFTGPSGRRTRNVHMSGAVTDPEKTLPSAAAEIHEISAADTDSKRSTSPQPTDSTPTATITSASFLIRPQSGLTKRLLARAAAARGPLRLPVLLESSYTSHPGLRDLDRCATLLALAGGVGITAILPILRGFSGPRARLCWGVRTAPIVARVQGELDALGREAEVEVFVGERMPVREIVRGELGRADDAGPVAVVVCGPVSMADEVNVLVGAMVASGEAKREVVFVNESFSW